MLLHEVGESQFALKNPNTPLTSITAFEQSPYPDDWRDVMRLFLVCRTRSFIIKNYAETDDRLVLVHHDQEPIRQPRILCSIGLA